MGSACSASVSRRWKRTQAVQSRLPSAGLTTGEPQVVPGTIGLVYDSTDLTEVVSRLRSAAGKVSGGGGDSDYPLEGTKFALRERGDEEAEEEGYVEVVCPYGRCRLGEDYCDLPLQ